MTIAPPLSAVGTEPTDFHAREGSMRARTLLFLDLSTVGLRGSPAKTVISVLIAAVAVTVLATGISLRGVSDARDDRVAMRSPVVGVAAETGDDLLYAGRSSFYGERPIAAQEVAVVGDPGLLPAGLTAIPGPGELAVSPALADLMRDPATTLARRYPGRITQTITPDGLVGPGELVIWIGRSAEDIGPDAVPIRSFGRSGSDSMAVPAELGPAQALLIVGFLIPLLALLVTTSTIGGAQRDRRLSALRLLGLSSRTVKLLTAGETGALALLGVVGGFLLFYGLCGPLAPIVPVNGGVWPADVHVGAGAVVVAALVIPALALVVSTAALGSVSVTPLAVFRRVTARPPALWRVLPLALGVGGLALSLLPVTLLPLATAPRSLLVVGSIGLSVVGLLTASSWIAHQAARPAERLDAGVGLSIAVRQVSQAAARTARTVTGLACLVAVSGILLSFFPLFADATASSQRGLVDRVGPALVVVSVPGDTRIDLAGIRAAPGVSAVAVGRQVPVQPLAPGTADTKGTGSVSELLALDCADLERVLDVPARDCRRGIAVGEDTAQRPVGDVTAVQATLARESADGGITFEAVGAGFSTPSRPAGSRTATLAADAYGLPTNYVVPVGSLPADLQTAMSSFPAQLFVRHDGAHLEEVRTAVALAVPTGAVLTTGERLAIAEKSTRTFRGLTVVAMACAAAVGLLALLTATVDQVREQGRVLSTLWVLGTSPRTLRALIVLQFMLVTVPALATATLVAVLAASAYLGLASDPPAVPVWQITGVGLGALTAAVLAAVAVMPLLRPTRLAGLPRE